jgi:hypothetical protein
MGIQAKRVTGMSRKSKGITKDWPESIKRPYESLRGVLLPNTIERFNQSFQLGDKERKREVNSETVPPIFKPAPLPRELFPSRGPHLA